MTIGDYPEYLAIGFLANQNILNINSDDIPIVEYYNDIETVVVRTKTKTNFEIQEKNKIKNFRLCKWNYFWKFARKL